MVTCRVCSAQFSEWHSLKIHHYSHTGERPFRCDDCGNRFTKGSSLSLHRLKHTGEKPHTCSTCGRSFRLFSTLKSHLLTHTGERPFWCDLCKAKFTQRSALKRHKKKHLNLRPFKCDVCNNSFRDKFYFNKHLARHEKKAKHSCEVCGEGFYSNKKLQVHAMKHNEGPNPYKCNKCSAEFVTRKGWRQHKTRNHERKEELRCEDCDATFKRKESFNAHKKVHSGENLVKCEFCQANFNNIRTLRKHLKKHKNNTMTRKQSSDKENSSGQEAKSVCCNKESLSCKYERTLVTRRQLRAHKCNVNCDNSTNTSQSDGKRTAITSNDQSIEEVSAPIASRYNDSSTHVLNQMSTSLQVEYKGPTIDKQSNSKIEPNSNEPTAFNKFSSEVSFQVTNISLKVQSRSDTHLVLTKSVTPPPLPSIPQESSAASLLSAVLQVTDTNFNKNEPRIL